MRGIKGAPAGPQEEPEATQRKGAANLLPTPATGVGTLDKCVAVLNAVRAGATTVVGVSTKTGLSRPTAHRLIAALEAHQLLTRGSDALLAIGPLATVLAADTAAQVMVACAAPLLSELRDRTGETTQLFRKVGDERVCAAAATGTGRLRDSVGVGDLLPMTAGSGAQVLTAWSATATGGPPKGARFDAADLAAVRRQGWAKSVGQRDAGLASVSAPVRARGEVIGAVCVAGPVQRVESYAARRWGPLVADTASTLTLRIGQVMGDADAVDG